MNTLNKYITRLRPGRGLHLLLQHSNKNGYTHYMISFNKIRDIILFLITIYTMAPAQESPLYFQQISTDDGLSQANITAILQDRQGFMWFGTFNGLNRYDGYEFEVFNYDPAVPQSLSHNYISALLEDSRGVLWVGTSDGLNFYNPAHKKFTVYKHEMGNPESLSDNQIESILEDTAGRLWIGTRNGGVNVFDPEQKKFLHPFRDVHGNNLLSSNSIRLIFEDSAGNIWIAHWDGTIDIVAPLDKVYGQADINRVKISDMPVTAIAEWEAGQMWIATQGNGLFQSSFRQGSFSILARYGASAKADVTINSDIILCLLVDRQNHLWVGTEDNGIGLLDSLDGDWRFFKHDPFRSSSLNHNSVWKIYQDRAGDIWVGTYAHGINLLAGQKSHFEHIRYSPGLNNGLNNNMVNAFSEDNHNNLWIATDGGGLNYYNRKRNSFTHFNRRTSPSGPDVIVSLLNDSRGRLWIGTWAEGLFRFDKSKKQFIHYPAGRYGFASNRISHIAEDRSGGLWLSTYWGGITYFNPQDGSVKIYNRKNSALSDNYVRTALTDSNEIVWIGTDTGLEQLDLKSDHFKQYKHNPSLAGSLSKGFVHSIFKSKDGTLWIGTAGGLNQYQPGTDSFKHYSTTDGLPNNEIKCIIEDERGNLFLSTNNGLSYFDRSSESFTNYDRTDGLQGTEFNIRSGIKMASGEILFGGNNGFNIIKTIHFKRNTFIPPVRITGLNIFNKPVQIGGKNSPLKTDISVTDTLKLLYRQRVFSLDFAALSFNTPQKNQYAYKLVGFDKDWNYIGNAHSATYTNLDPGSYTFRVKASNNDGLWNEKGTQLHIIIAPPFWRTWWAYSIGILLILLAIGLLAGYFYGRQKLRNALRIEHLELEKMFEMDQMKRRFFSNISHELHSPLTLILSPLEKLIAAQSTDGETGNTLQLIHRNALRLQRMTNQLRDFQKIESEELALSLSRGDIVHFIEGIFQAFQQLAEEKNISYSFTSTEETRLAWFDADKVDKIIYNLLSNAFKFTGRKGQVSLHLAFPNADNVKISPSGNDVPAQYLEVLVQDNGVGIPQNKLDQIFTRYYRVKDEQAIQPEGSGVGLALVHELVTLYQGKIEVQSEEGSGTGFKLWLPLDEQFLEAKQLVSAFRLSAPDASSEELSNAGSTTNNEEQLTAAQAEAPIILIVEDDKEIRHYIKSSLENKYRVLDAGNGHRGMETAMRVVPDLIISDINMPELDGLAFCRQLRIDEKTSHIPVILLTADTSQNSKLKGFKEGADAYLTKPFNMDVLEAQVVNLLETRKKLREKYARNLLNAPRAGHVNTIDEQFLQKLVDKVEQNLDDSSFNAEALSKLVAMSRMQLYRKIRNLTDQTVHEFIRTVRLKKAVQLLEERRMTITQVAYEVGFNDLTYFARCFRKQYHVSPSEYAAQK